MSILKPKLFFIILMQLLFAISITNTFSQNFSNQSAHIYISPGTHVKMEDVNLDNINSTIQNDGNILVTDGGIINNSGTITGYLTLQGSIAKTVNLGTLESFEQDNTANVTVNSNCSISKLLRLTSGTLISNGFDVTLKSTSAKTCLVHHNGGLTSDDFICQRWIENLGYHFISAPTTNAITNQLTDDIIINLSGNSPSAYLYNELNTTYGFRSRWDPIPNVVSPMLSGQGYIYYFNAGSGQIIDIEGPLTTGNVSMLLTYTESQPIPNTNTFSPEGWNLIGNPYQSPIDLDDLAASNPISVLNSFYRWDPTTNLYNSYVNTISSDPDFNDKVPPMQSFFVRISPHIQTAAQITFNNSMRVTDPNDTISPFLKIDRKLFRLKIAGQGQKNYSVIYFQNGATADFDADYDAYTLNPGTGNTIGFGSICEKLNLSINGLPVSNLSEVIIPLYVDISIPGTYEISLDEFSNFEVGSEVVLQDLLLSTSHILNHGPYTFQGNPSDGLKRFMINANLATANNNIPDLESSIDIHKSGNDLCIEFNQPTTENLSMRIFNVLGQTIFKKTISEGTKRQVIKLDIPHHHTYFIDIEGSKKATKIMW